MFSTSAQQSSVKKKLYFGRYVADCAGLTLQLALQELLDLAVCVVCYSATLLSVVAACFSLLVSCVSIATFLDVSSSGMMQRDFIGSHIPFHYRVYKHFQVSVWPFLF